MLNAQAVPTLLQPIASLFVEELVSVTHSNEHLFSLTITRPLRWSLLPGQFSG